MPVIATSGYQTVSQVLSRIRMILNDSEVVGGDVLTDTAPFTFDVVNAGFERVQVELATVGVETMAKETWLVALPSMPIIDPEGRLIINDAGANIIYPGVNAINNKFSAVPQLPPDLVVPLACWERQNGTSNFTGPKMRQSNDGLLNMQQTQFLIDWQWLEDGLYFRGALQSQDLKLRYEKQMPRLSSPSDPVPIRGVLNAAAYRSAEFFCESRGGQLSPQFMKNADDEIFLLKQVSARRRQRKQVRRRPYSGRGGRTGPIL